MIVLNGGSYYPESFDIDNKWISKIDKNDLIVFVPAATTKSQKEYFSFFKSKMGAYELTNVEWVDLYENWEKAHEAKVIYIAGGNTYKLIDVVKKVGFADFILAKHKELIVVGNSAGAVILGRDIRCANSEDIIGVNDYRGLGLVDYSICPHYSEQKYERLAELSRVLNHVVVGLPEQSALIIEKVQSVVNDVKFFKP